MPTNKECVAVVRSSDPYAKWARVYTIDDQKLDRRMQGEHTTEPSSLFGAGLARAIVHPMYTAGLDEDVQTVMRSQPYTQWASYRTKAGAYPHRTDHNKLVKTLAGMRTTSPSSALAKGLWLLLKQPVSPPDPGDPVPPKPGDPVWPPNVGTIAAVWAKGVVFTRTLSSFSGQVRAEAFANGFVVTAVQLDGAYYVPDNEQELELLRAELSMGNRQIVGWATYGQGAESPFDEGVRHSKIAIAKKLTGWIANGEAWAEAANIWKSGAWIDGWFAGGAGGGIPVACSCLSSPTPDWGREFDYQSWIERLPGSAIMPQVYGASISAYTVYNAEQTLKRMHVPKNRVNLTFDVINGQGPFSDYKTWPQSRGVWTGDDARVGTFPAFS
jgi:hypothetical protein